MSKYTEEILEGLVSALQVPPEDYEAALEQYESVSKWLKRSGATIQNGNPKVYIQGSFSLGTAISPVANDRDYDIDLVCELAFSKNQLTQKKLKTLLGNELRDYAQTNNLKKLKEKRRCWTQDYSGEAQFHMDILPALSDTKHQRILLEQRGVSTKLVDTVIAITDTKHEDFDIPSMNWHHSNPKGYASWFREQMGEIFESRCSEHVREVYESLGKDVPEYEVQTPLQSVIQILKCHRDMMFAEQPKDNKPISIIITTLAALAYKQESTISEALYKILNDMDKHIKHRGSVAWVANPTDPGENFADRWEEYPERKQAFETWLRQAQHDFRIAALASNYDEAKKALLSRFESKLIEEAFANRHRTSLAPINGDADYPSNMPDINHQQEPPWHWHPNLKPEWKAAIKKATMQRKNFMTRPFRSGQVIPKDFKLFFEAKTNISNPFDVHWQVVNTGLEAEENKGLRGGFHEGSVNGKNIRWEESTLYKGRHSIECFIVKDGYLVAQSGKFIVNIR